MQKGGNEDVGVKQEIYKKVGRRRDRNRREEERTEDIAKFCYDEQVVLGNEATLRRFHPSDKFYMNPIEVNACSDELSGGY